jgi:hypothetical protein
MGDLAAEVPRVERLAPDRFVHGAQVADGERAAAERRRERGVLQPRPRAFHGVVQDSRVVERQVPPDRADRFPARAAGVGPGGRHGEVRGDREVRHAHHPPARITVERAVGRQLLQVQGPPVQAGLLGQLALGRLPEILARAQEPAGQRLRALVRLVVPLDDQDVQAVVPHGQDRDVDGEVQQQVRTVGHVPDPILMSA